MSINPSSIPGVTLTPGNTVLKKQFFLTAGETDVHGAMPLRLMAMRAIETATDHSNILGIGYADLLPLGIGWVLARMTIDVERYPAINETYSVSTWIESTNKFFSTRNHLVTDSRGNICARIISIWAAIDIKSRSRADLSVLDPKLFVSEPKKIEIRKLPVPPLTESLNPRSKTITFQYTDTDFNGHVNAVSYIMAAINLHDIPFYRKNRVRRLDITYEHECHAGLPVEIYHASLPGSPDEEIVELHDAEGNRMAALRIRHISA